MSSLAEQVRELEAERDKWRTATAEKLHRIGHDAEVRLAAAESRLAQARDHFDAAITSAMQEMRGGFFTSIEMQGARCLEVRIRERVFPAVPEGGELELPIGASADGVGSAQGSVFRVGGSCADCQALNAEASVAWRFCHKHTLKLNTDVAGSVGFKASATSEIEEVMRLTPDGRVIVHLAAALRASERASSLAAQDGGSGNA